MQDPKAFSLQYGKDTTKDPSKGLLKKKSKKKTSNELFKDKTGILKIQESRSFQAGGKLTKFDADREKTFQSWYKRTADKLGLDKDPDNYQHYYDYRGFYKEYGDVPMEGGQHFTDTYKLPGHPTFSTQSKYATFYNKDQQGYWANPALETGSGPDNFVKISDSKLPIKNMQGAKLSIAGMGKMQGKAPIPTNYNIGQDKVKKSVALYKGKKKEPKTGFGH